MYRQALTLRPLGLLWPASASDPGQQDQSFIARPWAAPSCIVPLGRALSAKTLLPSYIRSTSLCHGYTILLLWLHCSGSCLSLSLAVVQ